MLFSPSLRALFGMPCLYWLSHTGTEENNLLLLTKISSMPTLPALPQDGTNFNVALSMLANSASLMAKIFVLSCLEVSVISPRTLTFSKLYSFVDQNLAPTEETLNSSVFVLLNNLLSSLTGSMLLLVISFSYITALFSLIVRIPECFFAVNERTTLSVLAGSSMPKSN